MQQDITSREALTFISEITKAMNHSDEPDGVLDQILYACMQSTGADSGSIMLLDNDRQTLTIRASRGFNVSGDAYTLRIGEGVTGWVALHGESRIVNDADREADYIKLKEELLSELAVPMIVKEGVIGVLSVDSSKRNAFTDNHRDFLAIMSNLAARIFINLQDNRLLKMRDRFQRVMIDISRVVTNSLKLEDIFEQTMSITEKAFRLHRSTLFLYDREEDVLKVAASIGPGREESLRVRYAPGEGITGSVFLNKQSIFIAHAGREPGFLNRMKTISPGEDMGYFCTPIFSGTDVVGVFSTFTDHHQGITDPQIIIEFLEILGSFISQAITIQKLIAEETRVIQFENLQLKQELSNKYKFGSLIGRSALMLKLYEKVRIIADSRASVLITGESGTGKELIASAIHYNSPRRDKPFIKINCAAIPENLLESELFGHKKGSFTGAIADKKGKFEIADEGTIFLDEIGELDMNLQSKLLRVLQEREIEPIGGRSRQVDIRVIAATNANLEELIARKGFRADLYYRLNVIHLKIPALKERKEDILLLMDHFIEKYNQENQKKIKGIDRQVIQLMENYDWPGNVRQLENVIERAVVLAQGEVIRVEDFQDSTLPFMQTSTGEEGDGGDGSLSGAGETTELTDRMLLSDDKLVEMDGRVYDTVIEEVERRLILLALRKFRYTKTRAARFLGINRNTLDKKIKELSIDY